MSYDLERIYELLPAVYRIRDTERRTADGAVPESVREPLRAFLSVLAEQTLVLEESIEQLYDDQFIETCAEWVVPYIGDLVGARGLHTPRGSGLSERAQVANTLGYRRRKGTAAVLERLARDVTGRDARAVEFFQRLTTTQHMNHIRLGNIASPDLRRWEPLERLSTPFDVLNHTLEVRRIEPRRGKYNIPNVGLFLWRLRAYPASAATPFEVDVHRYTFDPLGLSRPLFTLPEPEGEIAHLATPINVPLPISRRVLATAKDLYYGLGKSIFVKVSDTEVPGDQIEVCNLSDSGSGWANVPRDTYAIDPVLGRLALPQSVTPTSVLVTYHYGFSADIGGGEYDRADTLGDEPSSVGVPDDEATVQDALAEVAGDGVVELSKNNEYPFGPPGIQVAANSRIEVRAPDNRRPRVRLSADTPLSGGDEGMITLNGLLVVGKALVIEGDLTRVVLRDCTLVPGLDRKPDGSPLSPAAPSLVVKSPNVRVEIESSIVGAIRAVGGASVRIVNSIVDANEPTNIAYAASDDGTQAGGPLRVEESTVIGRVHAEALELASNSIFLGERSDGSPFELPLRIERRQEGCVRSSWLDPSAEAPRRYRCRPASGDDQTRMRPQFTSLRYGEPAYCQLSTRTPTEIREGADDEAEMGAFHDLYQPQRVANLRLRLDEYLRFGLEAGIFHAS